MSQFNETLHSKPVLTAGLMAIITVGLIVLEIYVDIHTGIENATTEYQKFVMGWMGAFLGAFSAISVVASGALKQLNKQTAFNALAFLSLLLAVYSLLVWISFFCTMWVDYSTTKIENSIEHRAKVLTVKALEDETSSIDSAQASSAHVTELNQTASAEDLAVKNCSKLKGWRKVRDCKNEHGAKYDAVNRELSEINSARESNKSRIDDLKSISGNDVDNSLTDFVMMPLAAMVTESKQTGKNLMLSVAVLITVIVSYITNCGLYFVGSLIGGDYLKRQQVSPALPINSEESRLWKSALEQNQNQNPKTTDATETDEKSALAQKPQSWADRYKSGEVSAWSGIFQNREQLPSVLNPVAYSVNSAEYTPAFTPDREQVFTRGFSANLETVNDDRIAFEPPAETETPRRPIGFAAWDSEEPVKKSTVNLAKTVNREQVFTPDREPAFTVEDEQESVNREQSERQAREHQKSFADLADEIVNGSVFRNRKISLRAVKEFMACRTEIAREFRNRLINEQIINEKGEVI